MSRIIQAREGYKENDLSKTKQAHTPEAIAHSMDHKESHKDGFTLPEIILGGQDGLVNVLGIILGIAVSTSSTEIVIVAGLAATFAESISMAAVAYTSKQAEADFYESEYEREKWEIEHEPEGEREEIRQLYKSYGFEGKILDEIVEKITSDEKVWLNVMMEQELKLEEINRKRIFPESLIVGISAVIGSLIPLTPFFFLPLQTAIFVSLVISAITLFAVGYYKARKTLGRDLIKQGLQMMIIGMVSAGVGFIIGKLLNVQGI